jgi:hypothetical protein
VEILLHVLLPLVPQLEEIAYIGSQSGVGGVKLTVEVHLQQQL